VYRTRACHPVDPRSEKERICRGAAARLLEELGVIYEEFKAEVRKASQAGGPSIGLLAIPDLRRTLGARTSREDFDAFVLRLHAEGLVHLMSHVDPDSLSGEALADCLTDETGLLLYWLRWL
jgi:hypothetical protein